MCVGMARQVLETQVDFKNWFHSLYIPFLEHIKAHQGAYYLLRYEVPLPLIAFFISLRCNPSCLRAALWCRHQWAIFLFESNTRVAAALMQAGWSMLVRVRNSYGAPPKLSAASKLLLIRKLSR